VKKGFVLLGIISVLLASSVLGFELDLDASSLLVGSNGVEFANASVDYMTGHDNFGRVIKSTDAGATWFSVTPGGGWPGIINTMNKIKCISVDNCWVVGYGTWSLNTTDGGTTWTIRSGQGGNPNIGFADAHALEYIDANNIWIGGRGGGDSILIHSNDGGVTWTTQINNDGGRINDIKCLNVNDCYYAAVSNTLRKSTIIMLLLVTL